MPVYFRSQYRLIVAALTIIGGGVLTSCSADLTAEGPSAETAVTTLPAVVTTAAPLDRAPITTTQAPTTVAPAIESTTSGIPATTTSTTTQPAAPERGWLTLQGVGDTSFDPSYIPNLTTEGYDFAFERLYGVFVADDLTVINLECAASELGTPLPYAFNFRCDPAALPVLAANGVDVLNLANNHGLDFGVEAMLDSRVNATDAGLAPVGTGKTVDEATAPAIFEVNGWKIAVLGMNGVVVHGWWLATDERPGMASGDNTAQMVRAVEAAAEIADIVVVSIHWLLELEAEPRPDDRARAEAMIAAGADVVFGHHPHVLGELEFIDGKPVFWTLGNFVWPRLSDTSATSAIGRVIVGPDGTIDACLIPVFIRTSGRPELDGLAPCHTG